MDILVFGAGAVGSFFGGLLSLQSEVTLIGRAEHVAAIRAHGLRISGKTVLVAKPQAATRLPRDAKADIVFVTTKAYDTREAMIALRRFANGSLFVTLQNGLGNAEIIAKTARRVVAGTTAHGVTWVGPGEIRHAGVGDTVVGAWKTVEKPELIRLRNVLSDAGIRSRTTDDVRTELWAKLVVNASINPLAALAGVPNGRIVRDARLRTILEAVCREAASVAMAEGARVDPDELVRRTVLVAKRTAANRGSMLQDLDRGRRTEIDAITGAIVRAATGHRIAAPLNEMLDALVRAREKRSGTAMDANLPS